MMDLKPQNTLYDRKSRTAKLVDLAGVIRHKDLKACEYKHITETSPRYLAPKLREENHDDNFDENTKFDLTKATSLTIGFMIEEMMNYIEKDYTKEIKTKIEALSADLQKEGKFPLDRISLEEGLKRLINIPDNIKTTSQNCKIYVELLKQKFKRKEPKIIRILDMKKDIYNICEYFNDKLKMTAQNPEKFTYHPSSSDDEDLLKGLHMLSNNKNNSSVSVRQAVVLLGSAGPGKSSLLQKMFLDSVKDWKEEKPIPIFINLAIENDLKSFWENLKEASGMKEMQDVLFEDLLKLPLLLFLDSLDESRLSLGLVRKIFSSFSSYTNMQSLNMIITCRTG